MITTGPAGYRVNRTDRKVLRDDDVAPVNATRASRRVEEQELRGVERLPSFQQRREDEDRRQSSTRRGFVSDRRKGTDRRVKAMVLGPGRERRFGPIDRRQQDDRRNKAWRDRRAALNRRRQVGIANPRTPASRGVANEYVTAAQLRYDVGRFLNEKA